MGYKKEDLIGDAEKEALIKNEIQEDYARVDIYYQTLNVHMIEQSPVISVR